VKEGREVGITAMDPADAATLSGVCALHERCFSTSGAEGGSSRGMSGGHGGWSGQDISRILASPGGFGFIAGGSLSGGFISGEFISGAEQETAGESLSPLGFVLCRMAGEDCEVLTFGVDPQIRGAGLGVRLLESAMNQAKAGGATRMVLEVAGDNDPARGLYERMGFREIGRRPGYYLRCSPRVGTEDAGMEIPPQRERADASVLACDIP